MTIRKSLAIALMGALGAFGMMQPTIPAIAQVASRRVGVTSTAGNFFGSGGFGYRKKDGHSVAHGKRMAAKARNVKRHKRAMKGGAK